MNLSIIFSFLGKFVDILFRRVNCERGTMPALRSYERKARHDYLKSTGVRLEKNQRIADFVLLEIRGCKNTNEVITILEKHNYPDGYILRFAHVWEYNEQINIEQ